MTTMREKLARALCLGDPDLVCGRRRMIKDPERSGWLKLIEDEADPVPEWQQGWVQQKVDAILDAMRDPSAEAIEAFYRGYNRPLSINRFEGPFQNGLEAMIAAIKEGK